MSGQETYRSGKLFFDLSKNMQLMGRWMNEREAVMDEYKLTDQEKEAVRNKDSRALYDLGMNPYLLIGAARFLGIGDPAGGPGAFMDAMRNQTTGTGRARDYVNSVYFPGPAKDGKYLVRNSDVEEGEKAKVIK